VAILGLSCALPVWGQTSPGSLTSLTGQQPSAPTTETPKTDQKLGKNVFNLLNMAGTRTAADFTPLNQRQRNRLYFDSLINPLSFVRVAFSAGLDQWNDKPDLWEQGGSGYGLRYGNIFGQYTIERTVTFGLSSALDEDNRYFNSGKKGLGRRIWYAVTGSVLARHHDGHRSIAFSHLGGIAAGAFVARAWLPKDQNSIGDAATSFGLTMAGNVGADVFKEFFPDIIHVFIRKPKSKDSDAHGIKPPMP
jgi:hypothetical protein